MRNLVAMKKWSVCLVAAVAACSGQAGNDAAADGNAGAEAAAEAGNDAAGNEAAAPAESNGTAAPAEGNATAESAAASYRASGTEPFWSLTMTDAQMVYDSADGPDVTVATPDAQSRRAGQLFPTPQMTVFVSAFRDCEGADEQEGNTVRVTIGGQTVTGCGSGTLPD